MGTSVIPGSPAGSDPEPMNTGHSQGAAGLCSWIPGSRAAPAPRNDEYLGYRHTLESEDPGRLAPRRGLLDLRFRGADGIGSRRGSLGTAYMRASFRSANLA